MEAGHHLRPHEPNRIAAEADKAKRLAPHIKNYGGLAVHSFELADGRWAVLRDPVEFGYKIQDEAPDSEPDCVHWEDDL